MTPEPHLGLVEETPAHVDAVLSPDDGVGLHLQKEWFLKLFNISTIHLEVTLAMIVGKMIPDTGPLAGEAASERHLQECQDHPGHWSHRVDNLSQVSRRRGL